MNANNKIYSTLGAFIVLSMLLIAFLVYPTYNDVKNTSEEVLSDREKISFLHLQAEEINSFEEKYKTYSRELARVDDLFVDPSNPVEFVEFLENTSESLGLSVEISLVQKPREKSSNSADVSTFKVYLEGNFQNSLTFIEKLEHGPYLLQIVSLTIGDVASNESNSSSTVIGTNLLVQVINK